MKDNKSMTKQIFVSSYFRKFFIIIIIIAALFFLFFPVKYKKVLTISHQETKEVYLKLSVNKGDIIEYAWIHSFEHIPWNEEYEIEESNNLMLTRIEVAGFGAGIPENKGTVSIENGIIIMRDINQEFEEINWINSNTALKCISLNDEEIIKGSDLPHHEPLNLKVKEELKICPRFR